MFVHYQNWNNPDTPGPQWFDTDTDFWTWSDPPPGAVVNPNWTAYLNADTGQVVYQKNDGSDWTMNAGEVYADTVQFAPATSTTLEDRLRSVFVPEMYVQWIAPVLRTAAGAQGDNRYSQDIMNAALAQEEASGGGLWTDSASLDPGHIALMIAGETPGTDDDAYVRQWMTTPEHNQIVNTVQGLIQAKAADDDKIGPALVDVGIGLVAGVATGIIPTGVAAPDVSGIAASSIDDEIVSGGAYSTGAIDTSAANAADFVNVTPIAAPDPVTVAPLDTTPAEVSAPEPLNSAVQQTLLPNESLEPWPNGPATYDASPAVNSVDDDALLSSNPVDISAPTVTPDDSLAHLFDSPSSIPSSPITGTVTQGGGSSILDSLKNIFTSPTAGAIKSAIGATAAVLSHGAAGSSAGARAGLAQPAGPVYTSPGVDNTALMIAAGLALVVVASKK